MDQPSSWRPYTPAIDLEALPKELVSHPLVVVHFWAVWDLHDRRMDKILQELRGRYAGSVEFRSLDVDLAEAHDLCRYCRIVNVPSLAAFVRGVWVDTLTGLRASAEIESQLEHWIRAAGTPHPMWDQEMDIAR
jgi:thioredoxin-like negative regulator of GroEL